MTQPRKIYVPDLNTYEDTEHVAVTEFPATKEAIEFVLAARVGDPDGRSEFKFFRLQNGDLIMGCYPCGSTYENVTDESY
tara:strand:+ start:771 stop:1010 length:240 start_codon:yes stop_codon:yes gene_type:complete